MAATYTKPTVIPRWADDDLNVTEPSEAKKDLGWIVDDVPPSSYENWKAKLIGEWIKWLDERFADGSDENELVIKYPESGDDAITLRLEGDASDEQTIVVGTNITNLQLESTKLIFGDWTTESHIRAITGGIQFSNQSNVINFGSNTFYPGTSGLSVGTSTNRFVFYGTTANFSGTATIDTVSCTTNLTVNGYIDCSGSDTYMVLSQATSPNEHYEEI